MTAPRGPEAGASEGREETQQRAAGEDRAAERPPEPSSAPSSAPSPAPVERAPLPQPEPVPRAGAPRPAQDGGGSGPGWSSGGTSAERPADRDPQRTSVLPPTTRPAAARPLPVRPEARAAASARPLSGRARRARLALRRIDPWSVFLFTLVAAVFLGLALVVAVAVLYAVLGSLGVTDSVNQLYLEVTGGSPTDDALLTSGRIVGGAAVLAAVNVVFLTLLATLGALLYNLCASFTGGIELTLGERD